VTVRPLMAVLVVFAAAVIGVPVFAEIGAPIVSVAQAQMLAQAQPRKPEKGKLYGDWGIECETQANKTELCFIQQTHTQSETKQRILSVVVGYIGPRGAPMMVAYTPLGIDLSAGAAIKVEPGPQINLRVQTCVPDGCRVAADLTEQQIAALRVAKSLTIGMIPWGQTQTTNIAISVNGFAAALAALK